MHFFLKLIAVTLFLDVASSAAVAPPLAIKISSGAHGGGGGESGGGHGEGGGSAGGGGHDGGTGDSGLTGGSGSSGGHTDTDTGGSSAGTGRGGSGDTGQPAISVASGSTRYADYFSPGGGSPTVVPQNSIFHGRQMGGGSRSEVPGTPAYGSGYPYTSESIVTYGVVGQPFPFGFWPTYWAGRAGSYEYGGNHTVEAQRPGGGQVLVQLAPNNSSSPWNTTTINGTNETYWMIGDTDSVTTLLSLLVDDHDTYPYGCNVQNLTIVPFNSTDPAAPVRFESVIQWYRASSFALVFEGYNNSYALPPLNKTADLGWDEATALPTALQYSPFLQCINATIAAALPILDSDSPPPGLSNGQIAGIVIGSVNGAILLAFLLCCTVRRYLHKRREREEPVEEEGSPSVTVCGGKAAVVPGTTGAASKEEKTLLDVPLIPPPTTTTTTTIDQADDMASSMSNSPLLLAPSLSIPQRSSMGEEGYGPAPEHSSETLVTENLRASFGHDRST